MDRTLPLRAGVATLRPGASIVVLPAGWRDLRAVRRLESVCFGADAWPLPDVLATLLWSDVVRLKAVVRGAAVPEGEAVVAFVAADPRVRRGLAWITTIGVLPAYRRQGLGERLLRACEARLDAPRLRLSVRASNAPAIRLYERLGYRQVQVWPHYYPGGEDGLVMEKERL